MSDIDYRKGILDHSKDELLAGEGLTKKIVKSGNHPSQSGAVLYKKDVAVIVRRQVAMTSSQGVFFSPRNASKGTRKSVRTLYRQKTEKQCPREGSGVEKQRCATE